MSDYSGQYFDGRSARLHQVTVRLTAQSVEISDGTGRLNENWPVSELWTPDKKLIAGKPAVLASHGNEDARLTVSDPSFAAALLHQTPRLGRSLMAGPERSKQVAIVFGLLIFCIGGLFAVLHFYAAPVARLIPPAWVSPLGDQAYSFLVGKRRICRSDEATAAINRLAGKFKDTLAAMPEVEILIVDHKMVNAFALPGGRIVFMRGIIDKMDNGNEFAAVLAHEMAHVKERHPTIAFVRAMGLNAILSIFTGGSDMIEALGNAGGLLAMLSYSRAYEADADRLAFAQLRAIKADPRGLATLFKKIEKKAATKKKDEDRVDFLIYLQTHPGVRERIAAAEADYWKHGFDGDALTATEWQAIKNVCR